MIDVSIGNELRRWPAPVAEPIDSYRMPFVVCDAFVLFASITYASNRYPVPQTTTEKRMVSSSGAC